MLTHIGQTPQTPPAEDDAARLLLECHARIRSFTLLAERLATTAGLAEKEIVEAAEGVRRYFAEALALHAQDEEESVLPRLGGRERQLDAALVAMHREHGEHRPVVDRVVALSAEIATEPGRLDALAPALGGAARALREHFDRHLAQEEAVVIPAIDRLLGPEERAEIVRELRARRQPA
jgi:iron-sulfur cluster repair protein YtfE (RIC family)